MSLVAPAPARPAPPTRPAPRRPVPAQSAPALPAPELPAPELPAPELPVPSILVPSLPASDLSAPATAPGRRVVVGQFDASHCRDNCVITSKFTVVNFLPLALFSEFRRAANGYYLFIGFLMYIGWYYAKQLDGFISPYQPGTTLGPLFLLISVSLLGEASNDARRHAADRELNNAAVDIVKGLTLTDDRDDTGGEAAAAAAAAVVDRLRDVVAGDVVCVRRGETAPCDLVILAASGEQHTCFIDTASIDGETNLKTRRAPAVAGFSWLEKKKKKTKGEGGGAGEHVCERACRAACASLELCTIACDAPNEHVNAFTGTISLQDKGSTGDSSSASGDAASAGDRALQVVPLNREHVVLRGSSVYSEWCLGCCVYSGMETKLALNMRRPPIKFSELDRSANAAVLVALGAQCLLALISTCCMLGWDRAHRSQLWYAGIDVSSTADYLRRDRWPDLEWTSSSPGFVGGFCTFFVLYCNFIPMSLYVCFDLAKLFHMRFIDWDARMAHVAAPGSAPQFARARSSTVTDLGQVKYVFSDKTGTLTRNEMQLRRVVATDAQVYACGDGDDELRLLSRCCFGETTPPNSSRALFLEAAQNSEGDSQRLLEALMLCHTVMVDESSDDDDDQGANVAYQAESPDEAALVSGGAAMGFRLERRTQKALVVRRSPPRAPGSACAVSAREEERAPPPPVSEGSSRRAPPPAVEGVEREELRDFSSSEEEEGSGGEEEHWEILGTNEFDNDRKRMSIFLREPKTRKILLFCKGADASMFERASAESTAAIARVSAVIDAYAQTGLRTLVFAAREWSDADFARWRDDHYAPAAAALDQREAPQAPACV